MWSNSSQEQHSLRWYQGMCNYDTNHLVLQSLHDVIALSSRDYSTNHRDAWVYGIVIGWGDAIDEVANKHGWSPETIERLKNMHIVYERIKSGK